MNHIKIIAFLILMALNGFALTVTLRNGSTVGGQFVSKDATNLILKTDSGEKAIRWRDMTTSSFKKTNPELYQKLVDKKIDEMKSKGYVKLGKKWVTKKEAEKIKYRDIKLQVNSQESKDAAKIEKNDNLLTSSKDCFFEINIKLERLDSKQRYLLKVVAEYQIETYKVKNPLTTKNHLEKSFHISNQEKFIKSIESPKYTQTKRTSTFEDSQEKKRKTVNYFGEELADYKVTVFLDGKLVYSKEKGQTPSYNLVSK